jgi:hypothetical protein
MSVLHQSNRHCGGKWKVSKYYLCQNMDEFKVSNHFIDKLSDNPIFKCKVDKKSTMKKFNTNLVIEFRLEGPEFLQLLLFTCRSCANPNFALLSPKSIQNSKLKPISMTLQRSGTYRGEGRSTR